MGYFDPDNPFADKASPSFFTSARAAEPQAPPDAVSAVSPGPRGATESWDQPQMRPIGTFEGLAFGGGAGAPTEVPVQATTPDQVEAARQRFGGTAPAQPGSEWLGSRDRPLDARGGVAGPVTESQFAPSPSGSVAVPTSAQPTESFFGGDRQGEINTNLAGMRAELAGRAAQEQRDAIINTRYRDAALQDHLAWVAKNDPRSQFDPNVRNAKMEAWLANNAGDVVLGDRRSRAEARAGRIAALSPAAAAAFAAGQQGPSFFNQGGGRETLVDDAMKIQAGRTAAEAGVRGGQGASLDLAAKRLGLQEQQQLAGLRAQLEKETDPAKRKALQDKLLTFMGKNPGQDKVAIIDVDTGQKDMMGQPIFKKAAINATTGELLHQGGTQQQGGGYKTKEEAHAAAKQAVATKKISVEEANKRLADAGWPTL